MQPILQIFLLRFTFKILLFYVYKYNFFGVRPANAQCRADLPVTYVLLAHSGRAFAKSSKEEVECLIEMEGEETAFFRDVGIISAPEQRNHQVVETG